jgi:catechol 2,3-dioxygenase-like lactoylglutathione lyase family enzyme
MPTHHRGRLVDHIHLRARDLEANRRFYRAILGALGRDAQGDDEHHFNSDELWIDAADDGAPATHIHLAFIAEDQDQVRAFHEAGLAAGGRDHGAPGEREYHPGYYAAFLLDPDGNNIEAVFHGPFERNVASVEYTPAMPG